MFVAFRIIVLNIWTGYIIVYSSFISNNNVQRSTYTFFITVLISYTALCENWVGFLFWNLQKSDRLIDSYEQMFVVPEHEPSLGSRRQV